MNYIKSIFKWIWQGKYLYTLVAIVFIVLLADKVYFSGLKRVDNIRVYGLFLQISGVLTIIYSLKEKLHLFEGFGLSNFIIKYFRSFPKKGEMKHYSLSGSAGGYSEVMAEIRGVIRPKEEINDVIRYFEEEIQYLNKKLAENNKELKKDMELIRTSLQDVKFSLRKQIEETNQLVSTSNVSNIWMDLFGVTITIVGLIYGTIPDIIEVLIW